ncbi:MAG TPA: pectinesterase family protein [Draconibacterium sp.]|mgnify:CR=1 FL=1|nr:pectinesterase family protein [Draconibacterium sp.]HRX11018.1 pectinesterase family protein [Draconibacterium sp.]
MKQTTAFFVFIFFFSWANAQTDIQYKMVVAQDGTGDFTKIQEAVDATKAFPDKRITIFIKNGIYNEKICIPSWNNLLSLVGENAEKTIITWNDYFDKIGRGRNSTFFTYTFKVEADDFYAENLTIINSSGQVGQAVALHVEGDRCVFRNCHIVGNQDTLYSNGEKSKHFFTGCTIEGTTDFIFGSATAVFSSCKIISKSDSYITAASTTQNKPFGFVFINCKLLSESGAKKVYLGRPWRIYAKTVFINCEIGSHILPEGWHNWDKTEAESTAFYAEYKNTGPGVNPEKRVKWSHQLSDEEAKKYSLENILGDWASINLNE